MKKILIIGSNGQLGSEIKSLSGLETDFEFLFTDVQELDATDFQALQLYCEENKPDFIVNCAAYTAVDIAETDVDLAKLINVSIPKYIGRVAKATKTRVIHISTDYVFDGMSYLPYVEDDLVGPNSVYGKTKLNGEIALIKEESKAIIIRTSWLYSSFGKNFVKTMIKLGEEREQLSVIADQVGTPTYARDLAEAIIAIIKQAEDNWQPGIYHYSNEGVASWYDFAKQIHELGNISCTVYPISTEDYPTPAKRPSYSILNKSKIKNTFGITIPYWRDSLKSCLNTLIK
ncbi:MAG: dTDP-4-dehydrorhamnose reductase [Mangrovibacterium sp.]